MIRGLRAGYGHRRLIASQCELGRTYEKFEKKNRKSVARRHVVGASSGGRAQIMRKTQYFRLFGPKISYGDVHLFRTI